MKTQALVRIVTPNGVDGILKPSALDDAISIVDIYIKQANPCQVEDIVTSLDNIFSKDMLVDKSTGDSWDFWKGVVYTHIGWQP